MRTVRLRLGAFACLVIVLALTGCSDGTASEASTDSSTTDADSSSTDTDSSSTDTDSSDTSTTDAGECGDGVVQPDEECDDGNTDEFDMCSSLCTAAPMPMLGLSFSAIKQFDFSWEPIVEAQWYQLLESANVGEPFVQLGGDIVGESISITMPLHFRAHASYRLRACNADGCWESATVDVVSNLAEAVGYFKASNTDAGDLFGGSVALSGDGTTLAVGASSERSSAMGINGDQADNSFGNGGAVYVFVRNGADWSQQAYVKSSNTSGNFGGSVALSDDGNTLTVAAQSEASNATGIDGNQADNSANGSGAVYVFVRNGAVWSQQAYVKASNTDQNDHFGSELALSSDGNTLAVSALDEDSIATGIDGDQNDDSFTAAGAAYVFVRDGAVWSQQAYVKASNPGEEDNFGWAIALSGDGDTLAVGALAEDSSATGIDGDQADQSAYAAGAAYVFVRNGGVWSQQAYVKASNTEPSDFFGFSMALSETGDTLVVAAGGEDSSAGIDGDQADNSLNAAGAVYVFVRDGAVWSQQAYVKASNAGPNDVFGQKVALSSDGNTLAVSAWAEGSSAVGIDGDQGDSLPSPGAAYVFVRNGAVWSQRAYVKASNTGSSDWLGFGLALSGDGETLAVGAIAENSSATGIGGDQTDDSANDAGAVYVY